MKNLGQNGLYTGFSEGGLKAPPPPFGMHFRGCLLKGHLFYIFFRGCAVADPASDSVLVIAGYHEDFYLSANVTRYNVNGYVESLPNLNVGRVQAGCSGYYNDADNLVKLYFIIAIVKLLANAKELT